MHSLVHFFLFSLRILIPVFIYSLIYDALCSLMLSWQLFNMHAFFLVYLRFVFIHTHRIHCHCFFHASMGSYLFTIRRLFICTVSHFISSILHRLAFCLL